MKKKKLLTSALVATVILGAGVTALAEGSRELNPEANNAKHRMYLEWNVKGNLAGITRKNDLKVYAKAGEKIYLGSSCYTSYDDKDIVIISPSGEETVLDVVENGEGSILQREQELAGPNVDGSNPVGYTPLEYEVAETGIYTVNFHSSSEKNNVDPKSTRASDIIGGADERNAVGAWDVSVYDEGGNYVPGRLFSKYLSLNNGVTYAYSGEFYVLTKDGYIYNVKLSSFAPYGYILYSNNRGLVDAGNNRALYKNAVFVDDSMTEIKGGIVAPNPENEDTEVDYTHYMFLNNPSADLPDSMPTTPQPAAEISDFAFEGSDKDNISKMGEEGEFKVNFSKASNYQIIIDTNKDGEFNSDDVVIADAAVEGDNTIKWNGKDRDGNSIEPGDYNVRIETKGGEYHFPMIDVENNYNGVISELTNDSRMTEAEKYTIYYDATDYITANGTKVELNADQATDLVPKDGTDGVNSETAAYKFKNGYGNNKLLDYWTYTKGENSETTLTIVKNSPEISVPPYDDPYDLTNGYAYIYGYDYERMAPDENMKLGESCAVLYRLLKQNNYTTDYHYDVNNTPLYPEFAGRWDRSAAEYMISKQILPADANKMNLDGFVERKVAFKLIAISLGYTEDTSLSYEEYAAILQDCNVLDGDENGDLNLNDNIKRDEFCKIYNMVIGRDDYEKYKLETADGKVITGETYGFKDLDDTDKWYYPIMIRATSAYDENGYVDISKRGIRNVLDDYQ